MSEQQQGVPTFHVDQVHTADHGFITQVLDMQAALPGVVRMRRWALDALAVQPGESALDIGSGTGSEVVAFAELVGVTGRAMGVDPNPTMLAIARERAAGTSAEFVEGTSYALPLGDAVIDVARCERVYQHLDDPEKATTELARVLKPGGRVVLIDSDWSTSITHPGDPDIVAILQRQMESASPNRNSGRRLRGLLTEAGFIIDDIGSEAVIWSPEAIMPMFTIFLEGNVEEGVITEAQRDQIVGELEHGIATGDYHFSVTMFAVVAHNPAN
ncbi:methyltransferase domain-containing protein [Nocardia sp. NPDC051030]|uniref:methyltransferase domain-containing protein n=1 Tax=Nocardia sp. NPDC051030 TaxID=3155162 RepID=UPI003418D022